MTHGVNKLRSAFLKVERGITRTAVAAGSLCLAIAALTGFYQVLARFVLFQPAAWSEPLIQAALIWMTYLALAGAMRTGTLISVDILRHAARGPFKRLLETFVVLAIAAVLLVLIWFGAILVWRVRFQNIAGLEVPASWAYAALPFGSLLSFIALVAHALDPAQHADIAPDAAG